MSITWARPRISVVIPTYNRAWSIVEAVGSVLSQTIGEIEAIVVDDGSSDDTAAALEGIQDPRLRVIRSGHFGANAARNRGVREASSEFVSFLDSDDILAPAWATTMLTLLSIADVASCGNTDQRNGVSIRSVSPRPLDPFFPQIVASFTHGGTYAMRRSLFEDVGGFAEDLRSSQHTELGLRVGKYARDHHVVFSHISESLMTYRVGTRDNIRSSWESLAAGSEYILRQHLDLYEQYPGEHARAEYRLGLRQLRAGHVTQSRRSFAGSFRRRPSLQTAARLAQTTASVLLSRSKCSVGGDGVK